MPRIVRTNYLCPACGYSTHKASNIKNHFYKLQKPCPKVENDIELTDEIKEYVIKNRVYHIPKKEQPPPSITQNINNINYYNNMVNNMMVKDKLDAYCGYNGIEIIDFEEKIDNMFKHTAKKLDRDAQKHFELKHEQFIDAIEDISGVKNAEFEKFNLKYDLSFDKIDIYDSGDWISFNIDKGIGKIFGILQDNIWNSYEKYLIRKMKNKGDVYNRQIVKELLTEYFTFIKCFNVFPFMNDHDDSDVFGEDYEGDAYEYTEKCMNLYNTIALTQSQINKNKRIVIDILKRNTKCNVHELNTQVAGLIRMDEDFKKHISDLLDGKIIIRSKPCQ
jgi:hypothetical protein